MECGRGRKGMAVGENRYFREALADFVQETAYGNAVRHLADRGYTVAQIMERLEYPAPCEKVRRMVWKHLEDNGVILREEPGSGRHRERFSYVKEYDRNGKPTFRRVPENREEPGAVSWREGILGAGAAAWAGGLPPLLEEKLAENGAESSYASCDFGRTAAKEPALYERILEALGGERAYVEGLPWERRRVYHRLDSHMREILALLVPAGLYQGELFFLKTGERIRIAGDREGRGSDVVSKRFF